VWEKKEPTPVAPEGFQTQQGFVTCLTPKLTGPFESALGLPPGGFNGAAADRFARAAARPIEQFSKRMSKMGLYF